MFSGKRVGCDSVKQEMPVGSGFYCAIHATAIIIRIYENSSSHSPKAIIDMQITFDPVKDGINIEKHGISLAAAVNFEWDEAIEWSDLRGNYGECRYCSIGYIGARLHYIVYVEREQVRRIISLRKANIREVRRYAEA
jgi:hypothetical protein